MKEKYIKLLSNHILKLNEKDFDFESWKSTAILLLESIYNKDNHKIQALKDIRYDQSSWSLRDSSGKEPFSETAKKSGKGILEAAIAELETVGLPEEKSIHLEGMEKIVSILQDELTGSQIKEIKAIVKTNKEKEEIIKKKLKTWGSEIPIDIVTKIICLPELTKHL